MIMVIGLIIILIFVLLLPFLLKYIERNLEIFLLLMGVLSAFISGVLDKELFLHALEDPITISLAVLIAGILFRWFKRPIELGIWKLSETMSARLFLSFIIILLGLLSSVITAIIAALVLVLIISILQYDRKTEIKAVILACFSIGFGAVLTPIGEPLATITTNKLNEEFLYLLNLLGTEIIVGVILIGVIAFFMLKPVKKQDSLTGQSGPESYKNICIRSAKIYLFVMGLTFLGAGFEPLVNLYLLDLNVGALYWINILSSVLDNATLAAAEISPAMDRDTLRYLLFSLIISGGMLIPGNIPNIISANKLAITSKEWARFGLPIGSVLLVIFFFYLSLVV